MESLLIQPRRANGDLPVVAFARLAGGSNLIDAGLAQGYVFNGAAPDLGAFEFGPVHQPSFSRIVVLPDGVSRLTFSGLQGQDYELRAATHSALAPLTLWDLLRAGTFGASSVIYDDSAAANHSMRFYLIRVP